MVLLPVCHRLHPKPVFPRTCRIVQNSECGEDHIFIAVVPERNILVWLAAAKTAEEGIRQHGKVAGELERSLSVVVFSRFNGSGIYHDLSGVTQIRQDIIRLMGPITMCIPGEAYNFHQEYLERVEKLLGDEDDVQLQPYHYKPWFLCMGDLSEDENNEANRSLAIWYDKDSVTLISED